MTPPRTATRTSGGYWIYRGVCPHGVRQFPRGQRGRWFARPAGGRTWVGTGVAIRRSAAGTQPPSVPTAGVASVFAASPPTHSVSVPSALSRAHVGLCGIPGVAWNLCWLPLFASRTLQVLSTGLDRRGSPSSPLVGGPWKHLGCGTFQCLPVGCLRPHCGFNTHLLMIKKLRPLTCPRTLGISTRGVVF